MHAQPVLAVDWPEGKPAPYLAVALAFAAMEGTTKRLIKDEILTELFLGVLRRSPGAHPMFVQHRPCRRP